MGTFRRGKVLPFGSLLRPRLIRLKGLQESQFSLLCCSETWRVAAISTCKANVHNRLLPCVGSERWHFADDQQSCQLEFPLSLSTSPWGIRTQRRPVSKDDLDSGRLGRNESLGSRLRRSLPGCRLEVIPEGELHHARLGECGTVESADDARAMYHSAEAIRIMQG